MRKKIFAPLLGAVVLGLSAYAGYRTYDAYAVNSEDDLLLANAEALAAGGEAGSESRLIDCYSGFSGKNTGNIYVKDCSPCGTEVRCVACFNAGRCRP